MRTFGSAMAVLSCGYLVVAVAWPHLAQRMLWMLLTTLSFGLVARRMYRASLPARTTHDTYSPFEGRRDGGYASAGPAAIGRLASGLEAAGDPETARRVAIPGPATHIILAEASRRLAEHHGLDLGARADHARIRALVSEPTWSLIGPAVLGTEPVAGASAYRGPVPVSDLDRILEDLERL